MKIEWRDGVATLLVAAIVVPYVGYLVRGRMPFLEDPRGMAATGLAFGLAAAAVLRREAFRGTWGVAAASSAIASGAVGVVTFIRADEGALGEGLLAVFIRRRGPLPRRCWPSGSPAERSTSRSTASAWTCCTAGPAS